MGGMETKNRGKFSAWYSRLDDTDRYGTVFWLIFGASVALMATVPALLVPIAIVVGIVMVSAVVLYWVSTPPHLFHMKRRQLPRAVPDLGEVTGSHRPETPA